MSLLRRHRAPTTQSTMEDMDEVVKGTKKTVEKGVKYVKDTAKAITKDSYATDADQYRSKSQKRRMKAGRRRNFANKMDIIDPHYGKKAAAVLATGTALGLAATTCPGVGAALGPAVGGVVIATGLAKLEHDAHKAVGDHATLDTLLDDTSDDWKAQQLMRMEKDEFEQQREEWLDDVLGYDDDDDDDDYYDYEIERSDERQGSGASGGSAQRDGHAASDTPPKSTAEAPSQDLLLDISGGSATASAADGSASASPAFDLLGNAIPPGGIDATDAAPPAAAAVPDDDPFSSLASRHAEEETAADGAFDFFAAQSAQTESGSAAGGAASIDTDPFASLTPSTTARAAPPASRYDAFKLT